MIANEIKIGKHYSHMTSEELSEYAKRNGLALSKSVRNLRSTVGDHIIENNINIFKKKYLSNVKDRNSIESQLR